MQDPMYAALTCGVCCVKIGVEHKELGSLPGAVGEGHVDGDNVTLGQE